MRRSIRIRYRGSWMDFCMDGMKDREYIKGKNKRYLRKWSQKRIRKVLESE